MDALLALVKNKFTGLQTQVLQDMDAVRLRMAALEEIVGMGRRSADTIDVRERLEIGKVYVRLENGIL